MTRRPKVKGKMWIKIVKIILEGIEMKFFTYKLIKIEDNIIE